VFLTAPSFEGTIKHYPTTSRKPELSNNPLHGNENIYGIKNFLGECGAVRVAIATILPFGILFVNLMGL